MSNLSYCIMDSAEIRVPSVLVVTERLQQFFVLHLVAGCYLRFSIRFFLHSLDNKLFVNVKANMTFLK